MKIIKVKDYDAMSKKAASMLENQLEEKLNSRICFATGNTPIGMYKILAKNNQAKKTTFKYAVTFNLDEYVGLDPKNPCSYHYFMNENLFNHIDINPKNINFPNGIGDIAKNAKKYEKIIEDNSQIDFMILGIGTNGHIAFNEPGSTPDQLTREVELTASTIKSNRIYFDNPNDIPKTAISMGIGSILKAKKIILLASGAAKAEAIRNAIKGEISSSCPASFLQKHKNVTFIVDEEAALML
ncbi:glucosamine-6-phosphate deaminase [Mycoplasmopsis lipofaciens]|uniref:glucosamine-6-phosphate deaminase n=1 Tax=Mycoplasmopsis lipofaciens TaxID=114884 RepID=UPI00047FD903|nr:glucosamine-6-phosphate deaminase [Mycoplasmopsis lipofaciens]